LLTAFALEQYEARLKTLYWLVPFIPLIISSGGNTGSQSATLIITALSRKHIGVSDWGKVLVRELVMGLLLGVGLAILGLLASLFMIDTEPREREIEQPAIEVSSDGGKTWFDSNPKDAQAPVQARLKPAIEVSSDGGRTWVDSSGEGSESSVRARLKGEQVSISRMAFFVVPVPLVLVVVSGTLTGSILPLLFEKIGLDPAMMSNPFVAGIVDIVGIVIYMTVAAWLVGV
jgi:magnesium transporter